MYNTNKGITPIKITINGQEYDYLINYQGESDKKWTHKLSDKYRFDTIGGVKCFIKRAYQKPPSGWELMKKLTGKPLQGMPKVYFTGESINDINQHHIYFTIISAEDGQTLKEAVVDNKNYDVKKLLKNVALALRFIHAQGYWFSDLNDQNIFLLKNGNFILIDVDSCWKNDIIPNPVSNTVGWIPNESYRYASLALNFYGKYLPQFSMTNYEKLGGKYLNFLQLIVICGKFQFYAEAKKSNPSTDYLRFFNTDKNEAILQSILDRNPNYLKAVFTHAHNQAIDENAFYRTIIGLEKFIDKPITISNQSNTTTTQTVNTSVPLPSIQFKVDKSVINQGETITLNWTISNAASITLEGNGLMRRTISAGSSTTIGNIQTNSTYTIVATNKDGKQVTKDIAVQLSKVPQTIPVSIPTPIYSNLINEFTVDSQKIKKGKSVSLQWEIAPQAEWIIIDTSKLPSNYKTEVEKNQVKTQSWQVLSQLNAAIIKKGNSTSNTSNQEDTKRVIPTAKTTYALVAKDNNSIDSKVVTISIDNGGTSTWKIVAAVIAFLIITFIGWQYSINQGYKEQIRDARNEAENKNYAQAVEYGEEAETKDNNLIIFDRDYDLVSDIKEWKMYSHIVEGDNLFKRGIINPVSFLDSSITECAFHKYEKAKEYDDNSNAHLKTMFELLDKIKEGDKIYDDPIKTTKTYFSAYESYDQTSKYMYDITNLDSTFFEGFKVYKQNGKKKPRIYIDEVNTVVESYFLKINLKIAVDFMENSTLRAEAHFFDTNEIPLPDQDGNYAKNGKVIDYIDDLKPSYEFSRFNKLAFSIPYSQLHLQANKKYNLKFKIIVLDSQGNTIQESDYQSVELNLI